MRFISFGVENYQLATHVKHAGATPEVKTNKQTNKQLIDLHKQRHQNEQIIDTTIETHDPNRSSSKIHTPPW